MKIQYKDYKNLIFHLSHKFHKATGIETEILISAGNEEFCKCKSTWDKSKAKFSTYLYIKLTGLFLEMNRKKNKIPKTTELSENDNLIFAQQEKQYIFKEIILNLSKEAKEVVQIVFETPVDLLDMVTDLKQPRGINKNQIQKYLKKQGWTFPKIKNTFAEIKNALKT